MSDSPNQDHSPYYKSIINSGTFPDLVVLEFGQPPTHKGEIEMREDDLVILLLGSDDVDGSTNPRGVLGLGTVRSVVIEGSNQSARATLTIDNIVTAGNIVSTAEIKSSAYFPGSGLDDIMIFGWDRNPQAHNCVRLYHPGDSAEARRGIFQRLIFILNDIQGDFFDRLLDNYPALRPYTQKTPETSMRSSSVSSRSRHVEDAIVMPPLSVDELADELFLPASAIEDMLWNLNHFKFLVLSGPPGTGKTHIARRLASFFADQSVSFVQFHPAYSYEYFVSGYRPAADNGGNVVYRLTPGALLTCLEAAKNEPEKPYVLIIDELNRANVSAVFGEFMSAMEYRDRPHQIQYGNPLSADGAMVVPQNFYIVATMNKADRSAGSFDAALRRRFGFYDCNPAEEPFGSVLEKFLSVAHPDAIDIAHRVSRINAVIPDPDYKIGASYFFGHEDLTASTVDRIFTYKIRPYIHAKFGDALVMANSSLFLDSHKNGSGSTSAFRDEDDFESE